ncbi:glycosyltransferase family 39 protein [Candidatus Woesearchaeota archaeon]|nr:glycosyltransferase family 39 protein [Candidatus Woesearchaeota archaeon]
MTLIRDLKDSSLLLILLFAAILRLLYWDKYFLVWWDSAVYLNIGRFLFSSGAVGLMEPLRPLGLPLLLGMAWRAGIDDILFSRFLGFAFSLGLIVAVYFLGKMFSREVASASAVLVSLSSVIFSFTFRNYTEIPAALFIVLAVLFSLRKNFLLAGASAGLAFLFKFPAGIVLLALLLTAGSIRNSLKIIASFSLAVSPYFWYNFITYDSFFQPLIEGSAIIKDAGIWIFAKPFWYYFAEVFKENSLHLFGLAGLFALLFFKGKRAVPLAFLLVFGYFLSLGHKETRFMILFLPLLSVLTAYGIKTLFRKVQVTIPVFFFSLVMFFIVVPATFDGYHYSYYHTFLKEKSFTREALTTHPVVALYANKAMIPAYFPIFNAALAEHWIAYIEKNAEDIDYVFLDTCGGGMLCPPFDASCPEKVKDLIALNRKLYSLAYYHEAQECSYYVFQRN